MQERRRKILKKLEETGKVRVNDLSRELACSEVTIRSDIKALEEQGLLERTHGGALKTVQKKYSAHGLYYNVDRKKQIASCAYERIENSDTIIIDDSTTAFYLAETIGNNPDKRVAVITNSLPVGNELAGKSHVELYMVGGPVGGNLSATMGEVTAGFILGFHVDKAFIGVHSINYDVGLTSIATPQMQVKQAILKAASRVYVLADSSKFGAGYVSVICPLNAVYEVITDSSVTENDIEKAKQKGVRLAVAGKTYDSIQY